MRSKENWTVFFQKSEHSSQNIILATFFKKKLFRTKYYLKKIMADFRKFIESISGEKKKISKNFAPTLNFLTNFTSASSSRALPKKNHMSALDLVKVHRKFQTISSQWLARRLKTLSKARWGRNFMKPLYYVITRAL